jgi:hypothetical protein
MSTPAPATETAVPTEMTIIKDGTGDKPAATPGHVIAGKSLRERWGIKAAAEPPKPAAPEPVEPEVTEKPKPRPAVKKKPATPPPVAVTAKQIEEIVEGVVRGATKPAAPAEPSKVADPLEKLDAKQKRKYQVMARMEELYPDSKGKALAYATAAAKLADYKTQWEKDNTGGKFDLNDAEHSAFLSENDVQYDPDEFDEARVSLVADERSKPIAEKLKAQEDERVMQERVTKALPRIQSLQKVAAKAFTAQVGGDFEKLLDEGGLIVPDELKKLQAGGKARNAVLGLAQRTELLSSVFSSYLDEGLFNKFNPQNPFHVEAVNFMAQEEEAIMKLPEDQRVNAEGKRFVTIPEWNGLTEKQREGCYRLSGVDLSALYAARMAENARALLKEDEDDFNAQAARRGLAPRQPAAPQPTRREVPLEAYTPPARPATIVTPPAERLRSPSGNVAPNVAPVAPLQQNDKKALLSRWTGR